MTDAWHIDNQTVETAYRLWRLTGFTHLPKETEIELFSDPQLLEDIELAYVLYKHKRDFNSDQSKADA